MVTLRVRWSVERVRRGGGGGGSLTRAGHRHGVEHLGLLGLRRRAEDVGVGVGRALGGGLGGEGGDLVDDVLHLVSEARGRRQRGIRGVRALEVLLEVRHGVERVALAPRARVPRADQSQDAFGPAALLVNQGGRLGAEHESTRLADEARLHGDLHRAEDRPGVQPDVDGARAGCAAAVQDVLHGPGLQSHLAQRGSAPVLSSLLLISCNQTTNSIVYCC